ncbi:hypothetical protein [Caballeronia concitans]|uniref:hypothetical protein n=1 Tax=Caballeronia concitans TaxID=1777133 RepID=UPI00135658C3|nr:hypothetical protein [Caballeronia concitans]
MNFTSIDRGREGDRFGGGVGLLMLLIVVLFVVVRCFVLRRVAPVSRILLSFRELWAATWRWVVVAGVLLPMRSFVVRRLAGSTR